MAAALLANGVNVGLRAAAMAVAMSGGMRPPWRLHGFIRHLRKLVHYRVGVAFVQHTNS